MSNYDEYNTYAYSYALTNTEGYIPADTTSAVGPNFLQHGLTETVEEMVRKQVQQIVGSQIPTTSRGGNRAVVGTEKLEVFDPDSTATKIEQWIVRFDELGDRYGWSDFEKMYLLKMKLQGRAREWYSRTDLNCPNFQWGDWKKELWRAFTLGSDFATDLEELVYRKQLPGETTLKYFHDKMTLCDRCEITGNRAVSCIIRGLPDDVKATAYALNCQSPEEFYSSFVERFDGIAQGKGRFSPPAESFRQGGLEDGGSSRHSKNSRWESSHESREKRPRNSSIDKEKSNKACYKCGQTGHFKRECKMSRSKNRVEKRCSCCRKMGHLLRDCPKFLRDLGESLW